MPADDPKETTRETAAEGDDLSRRKALEKLALYSALAGPALTVLLKPRQGQADPSGSGGGDNS